MATKHAQKLADRIARLAPQQQAIVEKLVQKIEVCSPQSELTLDQLVDEFEREHPELLRLLAQ